MNLFSWMLEDSFATKLTLTLLHFLWQGCCIGVLVVIGGAVSRKSSARSRCTVNVAAMLLMAACLPVTFFLIASPEVVANRPIASLPENGVQSPPSQDLEEPSLPFEGLVPMATEVTGAAEPAVQQSPTPAAINPPTRAPAAAPAFSLSAITSAFPTLSRWISLLYLTGVAFILGRLLHGVWGGHRLRRMAISIKDEALLASFRRLAHRVGLKAAPAIAWCEQISIPVVVGIVKPMILLPMALASSLTPDQLQALMLHELSHIRRFDPIINLLQRIVEALLFFHPVVWFVSRRISFERELAADDMVLAAGWDRPLYADALVRVAEIAAKISGSSSLRHAALLGATGKNRSDFKQRVLRLLGESHPPKLDLLRGGLGAMLLLLVMGGVFAWSQTEVRKPVEPKPEPANVAATKAETQATPTADDQADQDKEPYNAYMKIMDLAPMNECKAAIKRLDDADVTELAAQCRERLANRWKSISEQPVQTFLREIPKKDPGEGVERGGGPGIGVQTELDGVWSNGKGNADNWRKWILRKQNDYRVGRLQLLVEAAERYRKIDDTASAKRALISGLSGHEIFDADLKTLIEKYWPITSDDPAKTLGSAPEAWTLANFLTELSSAQQSLGEIDQAIHTHSRLMLVHFMLSWKDPSGGPTQIARELWALVRKKPESMPSLFWFNVVDEKNSSKQFDLSKFGQKDQWLTFHHQNLTAAPSLDFAELKITAKTRGRKGILDVNRINREGKQESLGVLQPSAEGEAEQTLTKTLKIPAGTGLVQFLVAGDDFQVGEVTVEATFTKRPESEIKASQQGRSDRAPQGAKILRKPAILLPDHWIMNTVAFDHDDKELITVSNQSFATVRRWDLVEKKLISEIKLQGDVHGRQFREGTFVFSGDRKKVVAATDTYVGIWDTTTGELLKKLTFPTKHGIYDCAIDKLDCNADLSVIAGNWATPGRLTLSYDANVMIWDGVSGALLQTVVDKGATDLKAIDLSADGKMLATTHGGGATIWNTSTGEELLHVPNDNSARVKADPKADSRYTDNVWSIQLSPSGKQLAMGDTLGVKLIDTTSGKLIQQLEGEYRYSSGASPPLVFSPDGLMIARLGTDGEKVGGEANAVVPIWSTTSGKQLFELHASANDAAFSADGKRFAVGFSDFQQAVAIWPLGDDATDPAKPEGPGPHTRQDRVEENGHYRGKVTAEYIEKFKPIWRRIKPGIEYGIALTKPQREFKIGERVPLVVFLRNASDKPLKIDTKPDCFGNAPRVLDAKGAAVELEKVPLLGNVPHYFEELGPSEAFGPLYLSFGLGENPTPGKQHWYPYLKMPQPGKYSLTHLISVNVGGPEKEDAKTAAEIVSGVIEFEVVEGAKPEAKSLGASETQPSGAAKQVDDSVEITGTVTNAKGEPIANAIVVGPIGYDRGTWKRLIVKDETDQEGKFSLIIKQSDFPSDLRSERFVNIWAWAKGYSIAAAATPNPLSADASSQTPKPISLTLPAQSRIYFIVKTETGKPLVGARVIPKTVRVPNGSEPIDGHNALYDNLPFEFQEIKKTDDEGRVYMEFMPREQLDSLYVISKSHGTQVVHLLNKKAETETLTMRPCGSLHGKLTGGPPNLMRRVRIVFTTSELGAESGATDGFADVITKDDGSFQIPNIASGRLSAKTTLNPKQPWKIVGDDHREMAISPGRDTEYNLYVEEGVPVTGRLVVKGGAEPVANAELIVTSGKFYNRDACVTDEKGEFHTFVVRGEEFHTQVIDLTRHPELTYPEPVGPSDILKIPRGLPSFRIPDIEIPKAKVYSGRLIDQSGKPVSGRYVVPHIGNATQHQKSRTDADGNFKLTLHDNQVPTRWFAILAWNPETPERQREEVETEVVTELPLLLRVTVPEEK